MGIYSLLLFMVIGYHVLMVTTIGHSLNSDDQIIMRLGHLESENKEQKHKLEFLELKLEDYHNGMKQMEGKLKYYVEELENKNCCDTYVEGGSIQTSASPKNAVFQHNGDNQHLQKGNKRPARLLPAYMFNKPKNKTYDENQQPSNCRDLNNLGHTLSGFFLVNKNKPATTNTVKLQVIYCDFTSSMFTSSAYAVTKDTEIGYLDIKTIDGGVHFYVHRSCSTPNKNGIIRFDLVKLNMGNAYNTSDGIFKAPKSGVYQFAFNALKSPLIQDYLVVYLRVNGVNIGITFSLFGLSQYPVSLHSTLKLKKGDRVYLYQGHGKFDCNDEELSSHFTGSLLEEDLFQ